ncbi:MAG TPA: hypothetical protein VMO20_05060, partial [Candidatus Acidoferrum sp.]|nr:hypothetical protein [Candidatus Acidoferrum sp.]
QVFGIGNSSRPFSFMGSISIWRRSVRVAEILAVFVSGKLREIAGHPGMGSTAGRAGRGRRNVLILPANIARQFLAGGGVRLVLSAYSVLCLVAGFSCRSAGLLVAMDFFVRG